MWQWALEHQTDILIALILAAVFAVFFGLIIAVFFEAFGIGSRIREWIRRAKNKSAGRSIYQLSKRIADQEEYRKSISTEHGLIVVLFRTILLILLSMSVSAILVIFGHGYLLPSYAVRDMGRLLDAAALAYLGLSLLGAFSGGKLAKLDTREKSGATIAKLDVEIAGMKKRLEILTQSHSAQQQP